MPRRQFISSVETKKALKALKAAGLTPHEVVFDHDGNLRIRISNQDHEDANLDAEFHTFFRTT